jgi:DNA-binding NtrC family response regulator
MNSLFLLITQSQESHWVRLLEETLLPVGNLQIATEASGIQYAVSREFKGIIIDAGSVDDLALLVSRIRAQQPMAKIIVVTASPTWQRAREAFLAGATDYIRKSLGKDDLRLAFDRVLNRSLQSRRQPTKEV